MENLEYYQKIAHDVIDRDRTRDERFQKIDKVVNMEFELPEDLAKLPSMRKYVLTGGADGVRSSTRAFATLMPNFELTPQHYTDEEYNRMERIEQALKWNFRCANRRGAGYPLWDIVESAVKYMAVTYQVEPIEGNDPRSKSLQKAGPFVWRIYNPQNVHPYYDDVGLQAVVLCTLITVEDAVLRFGQDNKGIKKLLKEIEGSKDSKGADRHSSWVTLYDYTDWTNRVRWISNSGDTLNTTGSGEFEITNEPHGLKFFPWVYRESGSPLLGPVVDGNLYEDACLMYSLQNWMVAIAAAHPAYATYTLTGKGVGINYRNPVATLALRSGETVQALPPRQLDPNYIAVVASLVERLQNTIGARYLQSFDFPANTPYATINAFIQSSITNLSQVRRLAEIALEDGQYLQLHWMKHKKLPLFGYRTTPLDDEVRKVGQQIMVNPDEYDPDTLQVFVELVADTSTDRQQKLNMAQVMKQLKVPTTRIHEFIGLDNSEVLVDQWSEEQISDAMVAAEVQRIQGGVQLELQAQAMQLQQAQMQEQQAQAQEAAPGFEGAQGPGFSPQMGGQPAQMSAPGMTREAMSGEDLSGQEVAVQ